MPKKLMHFVYIVTMVVGIFSLLKYVLPYYQMLQSN
jgi:hypothetical protein